MFRITYHWYERFELNAFSRNDYADATELFLAFREFIATHTGEFHLKFPDAQLTFGLDPDLSTIFLPLPDSLQQLMDKSTGVSEIDFFEQGTDIALEMRRSGDNVKIRLRKGNYPGKSFANLQDELDPVPVSEFLGEWARFLLTILRLLVDRHPTLSQDIDFIRYERVLTGLIG